MTRDEAYQPLYQSITQYLSRPEHLDFIRKAFDFAYDKHEGQMR